MINRRRIPILAAAAVVVALLLAACGSPGVSAEDAEVLRDELGTVNDRLDDIEAQIAELERDEVDAEQVAAAVREAIAEARATTDAVRGELEPPEPETFETAPLDTGPANPGTPAAPPLP